MLFTAILRCRVLTCACLAHLMIYVCYMAVGYDMEDAMILNKSAVERGLAHATMLKTETVDLSKETGDC